MSKRKKLWGDVIFEKLVRWAIRVPADHTGEWVIIFPRANDQV